MRLSTVILASCVMASGIWLLACGDNDSDSSSCKSESVTGLSAYSSALDSTDFCVSIEGSVSFRTTNQCPMGGYYLRDSANGTDFIYLSGFEPDTAQYPEDSTLAKDVRVEADYRPGETLCDSMLCHCQRKLYVHSVEGR